MKRKELLAKCEHLIKSFNPDRTTVDSHSDEELRTVDDDTTRLFLAQVFYGVVRYKQLLKLLLANFYHANASKVSRNDYTKFLIIGYLAIFRLEEIGMNQFSALVTALEPTSMHTFLSFLFDESHLRGSIRMDWIQVLDQEFIDDHLIAKMLKFRTEIDALVALLHTKAFSIGSSSSSEVPIPGSEHDKSNEVTHDPSMAMTMSRSKKPLTKPVSPRITKPKRPVAVEPMAIEQVVHLNPVPDFSKLTLAELEKQNEERRQQTKEQVLAKYRESAIQPFQLEQTRTNLEVIRQQVEAERSAECTFAFHAKPAPDPLANGGGASPPEVRLNAAAILREDALYKQKQQKEKRLLENYESELRDPTEFYRWQSAQIANDQELRKQQVEQRRLEMVQCQQNAIDASIRAKLENQQVANDMKKDSKEKLLHKTKETLQEQLVKRTVASEMKHIREVAPRQAEQAVLEEKQQIYKQVNEELALERERKAEQDRQDQLAREELIRQIRALDRVHKQTVVVFDPTSTAQLGLLEEMSLTELRERLQVMKQQQSEQEFAKRQEILETKRSKQDDMNQKLQALAKFRKQAAQNNDMLKQKRLQQKRHQQEQLDKQREQSSLLLADKITRQREERAKEMERLRQEAIEIAQKKMFVGAAQRMLEQTHFKELLSAQERQLSTWQRDNIHSAQVQEQIRAQSKQMRQEFAHQQQLAKEHQEIQKQLAYQQAKVEAKERVQQDKKTRQSMAVHEKKRFDFAQHVLNQRNVYAIHQNQVQLRQAQAIAKSKQLPVASSSNPTTHKSRTAHPNQETTT